LAKNCLTAFSHISTVVLLPSIGQDSITGVRLFVLLIEPDFASRLSALGEPNGQPIALTNLSRYFARLEELRS